MAMNQKTAIEYSNWLSNWCEMHNYRKVSNGAAEFGSNLFISDEHLFNTFKRDKERELLTKMYHAVKEINDGIFEEIHFRVERIAQILIDAGYSEDDIKTFVKQEIYPSYDYIIESI